MQIGNTKKPNSKKNTFVIGIAHVKDTYENLKICITILKEKLENLEKLEWEGKHIQLFLFGDYAFLTKLYKFIHFKTYFKMFKSSHVLSYCNITNQNLWVLS